MSACWIDTRTDEEARALDRDMWEMIGRQEPDGNFVAQASGPQPEDGEFWYDALNRTKDDPDLRYAMARRNLPLPAAWHEMAVAVRMKIRKARKEKTEYEVLLRELHHLAAMSSYAGYGYIQRVRYSRLESLDLGYGRVGCDRLDLLGMTDRKWMRELWDDPKEHATAAELYGKMLAADIKRIKSDKEQESREWIEGALGGLYRKFEEQRGGSASTSPAKPRGFFGWLFGRERNAPSR